MNSLLDQVNSLIKMQVGDQYRLEHLQSRLEQNKILTFSDKTYLSGLLDRYLRDLESDDHQTSKTKSILSSTVKSNSNYCGKCGNENPSLAKFCNNCGSPLEKLADTTRVIPEKSNDTTQMIPEKSADISRVIAEKVVDTTQASSEKPAQDTQSWIQTRSTTMPKGMGKRKKIVIGIGVIIIVIIFSRLIVGEEFFTSIENIINDWQQQLDSLLKGLTAELKATFSS